MALVKTDYCRVCEKVTRHINMKCSDCAERERREAMAVWQAKTTDEKLLDIHKRLLKLEAGPPTY
jgi:hypothetical protein